MLLLLEGYGFVCSKLPLAEVAKSGRIASTSTRGRRLPAGAGRSPAGQHPGPFEPDQSGSPTPGSRTGAGSLVHVTYPSAAASASWTDGPTHGLISFSSSSGPQPHRSGCTCLPHPRSGSCVGSRVGLKLRTKTRGYPTIHRQTLEAVYR